MVTPRLLHSSIPSQSLQFQFLIIHCLSHTSVNVCCVDMLPLYETLVADSVLDMDRSVLDSMRAKIDEELKKLDEK